VKGSDWYAQPVNYLTSKGVISGYPDGSYGPNKSITRAEFATIATKFNKLSHNGYNPFSDVSSSHWAYDSILSAYKSNWINGYPDGTFGPNKSITRAEAITIINNVLNRKIQTEDIPEELLTIFNDLDTSHWAFANIIEAAVSHEYDRKSDGFEIWKSYIFKGIRVIVDELSASPTPTAMAEPSQIPMPSTTPMPTATPTSTPPPTPAPSSED